MSDYFSKVPNFEYVSRLPDAHISDYITVKNLFKRGALEPDILENLALHTKYKFVVMTDQIMLLMITTKVLN